MGIKKREDLWLAKESVAKQWESDKVDKPVYVKLKNDEWVRAHFAVYKPDQENSFGVYANGKTSFTANAIHFYDEIVLAFDNTRC